MNVLFVAWAGCLACFWKECDIPIFNLPEMSHGERAVELEQFTSQSPIQHFACLRSYLRPAWVWIIFEASNIFQLGRDSLVPSTTKLLFLF